MADFDEKKEREAFETYLLGQNPLATTERHYSITDQYANVQVQCAWAGWKARASQPSAPALPVDTIKCAIHAIEFCKVGVEYRDTLVTYDAHIESLRALLPPAEQ